MPVQNILVCGYYGFGNAGDEAILSVLLEDLNYAYPGAAVTVLSGSPEHTRGLHGVEAIAWPDVKGVLTAAAAADLMVLGGGGLFQDYHGVDPDIMLTRWHGDVIWAEFALLARASGTSLSIYAVGVGPLTTPEGRRHTRLAFDAAGSASVRDQASLDLVAELGVDKGGLVLSADPGFRLEPAGEDLVGQLLEMERVPTAAALTVGVSVRPWRDTSWVSPLAAALDRLVEDHDARILLLPFQAAPQRAENDANIAVEVLHSMEQSDRAGIVRGDYTPAQRMALFGAFDVAVAMRLHAVMFAVRMGVPTVALAYDPKVAHLMEELAMGELVIDLASLTSEDVVSAVGRALKEPDRPNELETLRQRSLLSRSVLEAATQTEPRPLDDSLTAMARVAGARAVEALAVESLRWQLVEAQNRYADLQHAYDKMATDRAKILESRAMRLARSYWRAKTTLKDTATGVRGGAGKTARAIYRAMPAGVRPALRRLRPTPPAVAAQEEAITYGGDPELRRYYIGQLEKVLEDHPGVIGHVYYPHSIGWNTSLFQRPQQMALAFSRLGYLVFYGLDHVSREGTRGFREVAPRLFLASLEPELLDVLKRIPSPLTVTYVYNFSWTRHLTDPVAVFEHIDQLEVFAATHEMGHLERWYERAITGADVVSASAEDLLATIRERRPDAVLCPNGVDYAHFAGYQPDEPAPEDLVPVLETGKPIIGYYGALAEWFDYDLVAYSASALADHQFVFIGPDYDRSMRGREMFALPNVTWLGVKKYDELPRYLRYFDVATVPFIVTEVTHSVSPLKLFEYMAGGVPVVTPPLRECARFRVVQIAESPAQYVEQLRRGVELKKDPAHRELLQNTARANTWEIRAGTLIDAAARHRRR